MDGGIWTHYPKNPGSVDDAICWGISGVLVCLATCKRLINNLPKLSLITTYRYYYTIPGLYIPSGTTLLDHNARPAQISPAIYSLAAQRSAVRSRAEPCGAVPCPSLRCCVVLRCVPSFEHRAVPGIIRVVVYYFFSFSFSACIYLIFHGPLFFPPRKLPPYCRWERNTGNNKHTAQLSTTGQFALHKKLLALSNRCSHQIMGLFFLPPLHVFSRILPCLARA